MRIASCESLGILLYASYKLLIKIPDIQNIGVSYITAFRDSYVSLPFSALWGPVDSAALALPGPTIAPL